jgi:alpha-amylase/alpha-mannosidase (GH57 family)
MTSATIAHALGLHMHQPRGNLHALLDARPWEAEQILRCLERPLRYAERYPDVARLHVGFSGVLLEQLRDPTLIDRVRGIIDLPAMLGRYREAPNIELVGTGHFHPIFPLIPSADWEDQIRMGREITTDTFGRDPRGFWPPEMAFAMDMIPALIRAGYDYCVVDGVHVHPADGIQDVFRPYFACRDERCIGIVPRHRGLSNAQQSGLDADWFRLEVQTQCRASARPDSPRLVTTWCDGSTGGWFRQTHEPSGFFGRYLAPYMEQVRAQQTASQPVMLSEYLDHHVSAVQAQIQTGAWNVGTNSGADFRQWAGSVSQRGAAARVNALSQAWWTLHQTLGNADAALTEARHLILEAQTSCFLAWDDAWRPRLHALTEQAVAGMRRAAEAACRTDLLDLLAQAAAADGSAGS